MLDTSRLPDGYLDECLAKSESFTGDDTYANNLQQRLDYLRDYGEHENQCTLFKDFANYSFTFNMCKPDGELWFPGGLIFSEPAGDRHDKYGGWSVHT